MVQLPSYRHLLTLSPVIASIPGLASMLDCKTVSRVSRWWPWPLSRADAVLAWGRKPSSLKVEAFARRSGLPILRLEDGFVRSLHLGHLSPPGSLVIDDVGIYYDAHSPSRLEQLISLPLNEQQLTRAALLRQLWQTANISKYNHSPDADIDLGQDFVLVVDQTFGDASIGYGLAGASHFEQMLYSALQDYPDSTIVVKTHPDVLVGNKTGYLTALSHKLGSRLKLLAKDWHAPSILRQARAVYCVTSQMGFEALLWNKPVYTFGMPFYAGWGLTQDALPAPDRRMAVRLEQLVYAALIAYPRYIDPQTLLPISVEVFVEHLAMQRQQLSLHN